MDEIRTRIFLSHNQELWPIKLPLPSKIIRGLLFPTGPIGWHFWYGRAVLYYPTCSHIKRYRTSLIFFPEGPALRFIPRAWPHPDATGSGVTHYREGEFQPLALTIIPVF